MKNKISNLTEEKKFMNRMLRKRGIEALFYEPSLAEKNFEKRKFL